MSAMGARGKSFAGPRRGARGRRGPGRAGLGAAGRGRHGTERAGLFGRVRAVAGGALTWKSSTCAYQSELPPKVWCARDSGAPPEHVTASEKRYYDGAVPSFTRSPSWQLFGTSVCPGDGRSTPREVHEGRAARRQRGQAKVPLNEQTSSSRRGWGQVPICGGLRRVPRAPANHRAAPRQRGLAPTGRYVR